jgi:hypothetical protein
MSPGALARQCPPFAPLTLTTAPPFLRVNNIRSMNDSGISLLLAISLLKTNPLPYRCPNSKSASIAYSVLLDNFILIAPFLYMSWEFYNLFHYI